MQSGSSGAPLSSPGRQVVSTNVRHFLHLCFLLRRRIPRRFARAQKVVVAAKDDVRGRWPRFLVLRCGGAGVGHDTA